MDAARAAPTVAAVACVAVLALLVAPYLLVDRAAAVTGYYGAGAVPAFAAGLLALVGVIVFAAGREGRSDPALVAGAGLVFGLFMVVIAGLWALAVPEYLVLQLGEVREGAWFLEYHRYLVALAAAAVLLAAVWYARALRLL